MTVVVLEYCSCRKIITVIGTSVLVVYRSAVTFIILECCVKCIPAPDPRICTGCSHRVIVHQIIFYQCSPCGIYKDTITADICQIVIAHNIVQACLISSFSPDTSRTFSVTADFFPIAVILIQFCQPDCLNTTTVYLIDTVILNRHSVEHRINFIFIVVFDFYTDTTAQFICVIVLIPINIMNITAVQIHSFIYTFCISITFKCLFGILIDQNMHTKRPEFFTVHKRCIFLVVFIFHFRGFIKHIIICHFNSRDIYIFHILNENCFTVLKSCVDDRHFPFPVSAN